MLCPPFDGLAGEAGPRRVPGWGGAGEEPAESRAEGGGRTGDAETATGGAPTLGGDKTTKAPFADKKAPPTATPGHKEPKPLPLSATPENQPPAKSPTPSTAQVAGPQTKARSPVPPPPGATGPPSTAATPASAAASASATATALGGSTTQEKEKEKEARGKEQALPQHTGKAAWSPGLRTDAAAPGAEE